MYEIRPHSGSSDALCDGRCVALTDSAPAQDCGAGTTPTHGDLTEGGGQCVPLMPPAEELASLTDKQRMVLRAKLDGGQTFDRIGHCIGVSRQAAHRIFHRALSRMAKAR